ncbi:MAG: HD domain-containing protein [Liquorilactobacillus ghanensis]|uniref:HD domain-containing protein n=1 Tax=Liquorilactobacillus ghanensis TaxID=399370 RepID=UPI0039E89170
MNIEQQLAAVRRYTCKKMKNDKTGHGFDHIQRVVATAQYLAAHESQTTDRLIVISAAYLHDITDDKLVADSQKSEAELRLFLESIEFSTTQIAAVVAITHNLSFSKSLEKNPPRLSLAGQIVQDADRLDAIGAIGIARAIYYGGTHQETIYDPQIKPRKSLSKTEYRNLNNETIINHFYEKLLKLKDLMNTVSGKQLAEQRQQFMLTFLTEFKAEWQGKS